MKEGIPRVKLNIISKKNEGKIKMTKLSDLKCAAAYIKRDGRKV